MDFTTAGHIFNYYEWGGGGMTIIENKLADENVSSLKGSRQRHR